MSEEVKEIALKEKIVDKIKDIILKQQELQASLVDTVQTILDYEGLDGTWDFARIEGGIDITRLVKQTNPLEEIKKEEV